VLLHGSWFPEDFRLSSIGLVGFPELVLFGLRSGLTGTAKVREGSLLLASLVCFSSSGTVFAGAGCAFAEMVGDKG